MNRLFGKKKKKVKLDEVNADDDSNNYYRHHDGTSTSNDAILAGSSENTRYDLLGKNTNSSNASSNNGNDSFPDIGVDITTNTNNRRVPHYGVAAAYNVTSPSASSIGAVMATTSSLSNDDNTPNNNNNDIVAGYRYARTAFNDTINPEYSNEDGMGGGGGTLRSRLRGSGGSKHRSLIPSFQQYYNRSDNNNTTTQQQQQQQQQRKENWSPIPEKPRSDKCDSPSSISKKVTFGDSTEQQQQTSNQQQQVIPPSSTRSSSGPSSLRNSSFDDHHQQTQKQHHQQQHGNQKIILQPDAIYEENYGDAYIDQLPKYIYPSGYQSMRPRSGPWKLSIFIFCLFCWLSVFIVGHCYDRGKRQYMQNMANENGNYNYYNGGGGGVNDDVVNDGNANNNNNNNNNAMVDDAYLEEVEDDAILMDMRWCGSKLLHYMWMLSVAITMLAMSYCSIIGYVKVRDVAVAAGRSQPAGSFVFGGGDERSGSGGGSGSFSSNDDGGWRSDYYSKVDNVSSNSRRGNSNDNDEEDGGGSSNPNDQYSSYQAGGDGSRYVPSIYQSDGMPQFLGGHIYRPTQAAITMTNRP